MKSAVLIRGHHYYTSPIRNSLAFNSRMVGSPTSFDYRNCINNIQENIIKPLKEIGEIDVFISTQHSDIEQTLNDVPYVKKVVHPAYPECQLSTITTGLREIDDSYDFYLILRFDAVYKKPLNDFWDYKKEETVFCLWKETEQYWKTHKRLPDTMYIINGKNSWIDFKKAILEYFHEDNFDYIGYALNGDWYTPAVGLHYLYPFLEKNCRKIEFIVDGYYDSGTSLPNPVSKNPIYVLYGRPYHFDDFPKL